MLTLKHFWLLSFLFSLSSEALAFTAPPGKLARFQSARLSRERPFRSEGTIKIAAQNLNYNLRWASPGNYDLSVAGIPATFYSNAGVSSSEWTVSRRAGRCTIKTQSQLLNCGGPGVWGILELGGRPEQSAETLLQLGLLNKAAFAEIEVDSKNIDSVKAAPNSQIVLGKNHGMPVAYIELRGENVSQDSEGRLFPSIRYDQTFLAPRLLRLKSSDHLFNIEAHGDLDIERGRPRHSFILAEKLVVTNQKGQEVIITRKGPVTIPSTDKSLNLPLEKTPYEVSILLDSLNFDGQYLLDALLQTH